MKFVTMIRFERYPDEVDEASADEVALFECAFNSLARLKDHPEVLAKLAEHAVGGPDDKQCPDSYERAKRIAHMLTNSGDMTEPLTLEYLTKAGLVLSALQIALERDQHADYSPTPEHLVAVLLEARRTQIAAIAPAVALLDRTLRACGYRLPVLA